MNKFRYHYAAFAALLFVTLMTACTGSNPVKPAIEAKRPDLVAYALEGSYTIVQGKALAVVQDPATPQAVKDAIAQIDAKANPILDKLRPLAEEAEALRQRIADGEQSAQARLTIVLNDLDRLVTEVSPLITDLVNAISAVGD